MSIQLFNLGRFEESIEGFSEAIRRAPHLAAAYNGRGVGYRMIDCPEKSLEDFNAALALEPTSSGSMYVSRGFAYRAMAGHEEQAMQDLQRAVELLLVEVEDSTDRATYFLGRAYRGMGRLEEAIATQNKALENDPQHTRAFAERSYAHLQAGRLEQADADMMRALQLTPTSTTHCYCCILSNPLTLIRPRAQNGGATCSTHRAAPRASGAEADCSSQCPRAAHRPRVPSIHGPTHATRTFTRFLPIRRSAERTCQQVMPPFARCDPRMK